MRTMVIKRIGVLLAMLAMLVLVVTGCSETKSPAPGAAQPSAGGTATAKAQPPVAVMKILPVAANPADPNVVVASLPGTTTTLALGASGEQVVSVGVPVSLKGGVADAKNAAKTYTWTLAGPSASKATLTKKDGDSTKFTPDVPGIYKVDLVAANDAGNSPMVSMQIQAATYVGVDRGNCKNCHADKYDGWAKTPHATKLTREIDGGATPATSHYSESCLRCHTVGYNIGVQNGGFADIQAKLGWKFPTLASIQSGTAGNWNAIPADLKNVSNIQCENCHGPASAHLASKAPMAVSLDEGVCNVCHNGGGSHVKGEMFKNSAHGEADAQAWTYPTGPDHQACVRCHSGNGFISFTENPKEQASWNNEPHTVTCAVCHDPHSDENKDQLRVVGKPVEANGVTKDFALSAVCATCHNGRSNAADAPKGATPHYSAAAEMLSGTGGYEYGQKIQDSPHATIVGASPVKDPSDKTGQAMLFGGNAPGSCVYCHMWPTPAAGDPQQYKVGDHSFNTVSPDGKYDYVAACQQCHNGITDFNFKAKADYDGNGSVDGVQDEVAGLLKKLQGAIGDSGIKPVEGHPYFDAAAKAKATDKQNEAIFNYLFVRGVEGTDGKAAAIHNFKRSVMLLQQSYKDLTGKDVPGATILQ